MDKKARQKRVARVVFGVLLVGVGVLFSLDNLDVLEAGSLRSYWPLFLIGVGLPSVIAPRDPGDTVFGVLFTAGGSFLMLRKFDLVEWSIWQVWPVFLVVAGIALIVQTMAERRRLHETGIGPLENGGAQ